jgi:hypothetical protein
MLRIKPTIVQKNGIYCYDTKLHIGNERIDLTKKWHSLNIRNKKLKINDMQTPLEISKRFYQFLNKKDKYSFCYDFAKAVVESPEKCYNRWIHTGELDTLKPFDKVELFHIVNDMYEESKHMSLYIGRHFNNTDAEEHLFLSKIGRLGIYVTDIQQLLFIYQSTNTHMKLHRIFAPFVKK